MVITLASGAEPRAAVTSDALRKAISAGLPKYDAKVRAAEKAELSKESAAVDAVVAYGVKAGDLETTAGATSDEEIVMLPRMVVELADWAEETKSELAVRLPRLVVRPKEGPAPEEFETPAARDERLVKKHLSALDRSVLNRFTLFGKTKEQRAREAEAIEQNARALGEMAELIELTEEESGGRDAEEKRKLRELYLDVFVSRPR